MVDRATSEPVLTGRDSAWPGRSEHGPSNPWRSRGTVRAPKFVWRSEENVSERGLSVRGRLQLIPSVLGKPTALLSGGQKFAWQVRSSRVIAKSGFIRSGALKFVEVGQIMSLPITPTAPLCGSRSVFSWSNQELAGPVNAQLGATSRNKSWQTHGRRNSPEAL